MDESWMKAVRLRIASQVCSEIYKNTEIIGEVPVSEVGAWPGLAPISGAWRVYCGDSKYELTDQPMAWVIVAAVVALIAFP